MQLLIGSIAFDLLLAWLIWRMARQARRYASLGPEAARGASGQPRVAVIIPARNEAAMIGRCVKGLLAQDYPADRFAVCVIDDGSTDGTVRAALEAAGSDSRFRLLHGAVLPADWTGKSFACWQGVTESGAVDYLCFVDADTMAEPGLLTAAVAHAEGSWAAMVSLEPFQELGSVAERLVLPCGFYLVAASQDLGRIQDPSDDKAAANGQFILIRSAAYEAVGGHAAVRSEVCEDTALARLVKAKGLRYDLLGAERLIRTRMYTGWTSLWAGLSKNATELGGGPLPAVLIAGAGLMTVLAAFALVALNLRNVTGSPSASGYASALLIACGVAAMIGLHVAGARHFGIPPAYGLLFPIGYALTFALALNSARAAWAGRVEWKGRTYVRPRIADQATGQVPSRRRSFE